MPRNRKHVDGASAVVKRAPQPKARNRPTPPILSNGPQTKKTGGQPGTRLAKPTSSNSFPIVGIGASAGGLEAFTDLLKHLPSDTGMGFVLVQHLHPEHESALSHLLGRVTSLPVQEVTNNLRVEPNHVYAIPPNTSLAIDRGLLKLRPRPQNRIPARPIDAFFESLAGDQRERAIGVVLSGTASDGTAGLEAIKAEGGITFAQDDSARYDSMPRSAVAAGCVDFVLKPEEIARELARIAKHPFVADYLRENASAEESRTSAVAHEDDPTALPSGGRGTRSTGTAAMRTQTDAFSTTAENGVRRILLLLSSHSGVDFSLYKSATIQRRITRRVVLNKLSTVQEYAVFLRGNAKELDALYSDVLISVTSFFRNPEAFKALKRNIFPKLLQQRRDEPVRVWVLGCSTGQEAYSIAMAFVEAAENAPRARKLQVFATDLNEALLDKARHALYSKSLAQDVSPDRLRRFFIEEEGGYRLSKSLREMVVFARQNLITDPPFSRIDLISCRNLLIYLQPSLQQKVMPAFHYALNPEGFLFLGASESIGHFTDLFEPADRKHKIYIRKAAAPQPFNLPLRRDRTQRASVNRRPISAFGKRLPEPPNAFGGELSAQREADRLTVNQLAPPGVLINAESQILQFRGATNAYLQPPPTGKASFDVLKMAREGLMLPLRAAINKARKENKTVRKEQVGIEENGHRRTINIQVIPLKNLRERCFLILFEDAGTKLLQEQTKETKERQKQEGQTPALSSLPSVKRASLAAHRVSALESELSETRDFLQSIQEQHEAANEELQASSEEVQSANEELQSINEELETSKEELESANEELTTVNEEMASRNAELNRLNADLINFHASAKLPVLLLGRDLTVCRFSAPAEKIFNLVATDIGRPLDTVRHHLVLPALGSDVPTTSRLDKPLPLEELVRQVIDTVQEQEREVCDKGGRWYSLRIRPYLTLENKVDGAVLVLNDITELKRIEHEVTLARDYAEATIRTARDPLVVLHADLRVDRANEAFYKTFKITARETENVLIYELEGGQWNIPKLRQLLEEVIPRNSFFNDFEVTHDFDQIGRRTMLLNARRLDNPSGQPEKILLGIEDITERQRTSEATSQLAAIFQTSEDGIFTQTLDGFITSWNPAAEQMFGYPTEEIMGKNISILIPPACQDDPRRIVEHLRRGERITNFETQGLHKDGSTAWMLLSVAPIRDETGHLTGASVIARDISDRKRVDEALKTSHDQLATELAGTRRLQETSTLLISGRDIDALYHQILDAAIALMRSDMGSMQKYHPDRGELHLLAWKGFDPESAAFWKWVRPASVSTCGVALRTGQRVIVPEIEASDFLAGTDDLASYRKSGIRAVQSTPLMSRSGKVVGMISTHWREPHRPDEREFRVLDVLARQAADLIDRSQTEQARTRLAAIVESSDDAIISKDLNGVITSWNQGAERLFGYTAAEVVGKPVTILMPPDRISEEPGILERIRRGESVEHYETVRQRKNGTRIDVSLTVSPIKNDAGKVIGASKIARDITERKCTEESLRQAQAQLADRAGQLAQAVSERTAELTMTNQQLEAFVYSVAHDLRAPLRAMEGFSSLLVKEVGKALSQTGRKYAQRINKSAQFMDAMLIDMLAYSRINQQHFELGPVNLERVIAEVLPRLDQDIQEKKARVEALGQWPSVLAHEPLLTQALFNLLSNALKFTRPGIPPVVGLRAEETPDSIRVWVEDNGIGIAPEHQQQIFRLFNRLHGEKYPGTGIGLAIVQKGVERMRGRVGVESIPGRGSRFWMDLRKVTKP